MEVKLTRPGAQGVEGRPRWPVAPGATLAMEIMARVKHAELENISEMITRLIERYG